MTDIRDVIKENVKTYRKKQHLSQAQLAEKAGISTTYIGEIETSRKYPSVKTLTKIAGALSVEPFRLLMNTAPPTLDIIERYNKELRKGFDEMLSELQSFQ